MSFERNADQSKDGSASKSPRPELGSGAWVQHQLTAELSRQAQALELVQGDSPPGGDVHAAAAHGVSGAGGQLPHLDAVQHAFGRHDVSGISAHVGGRAAEANAAMGSSGYATGNAVAFAQTPDLHTAAHEAAHVVQQRQGVQLKGGVGQAGDPYERHADAVADAVVEGRSAESLLDGGPGGGGGRAVQQQVQFEGEGEGEGGKKVAAAPAPKPADTTPEVGASDVVLTRDASYATASYVSWFSDQVKAKITSWGLTYDASTVKLAQVTQGETKTKVIALKWDANWGTQPTTKNLVGFGMEPIDARASVKGVQSLAGWAEVGSTEKAQVTALLGGETNKLSAAARGHLRGQFGGLSGKTKAQQASAIKGVIGNKDAMPGVVDEQVETTAVTYTLGSATVVKDYQFRGKKADAEQTEATFSDGAKIKIIAPKAPEAGYHQHTVAEAADAAAYLPKKSRAVVKEIVLNIVSNPDDAYWAVEYNSPGFHSYMTAGQSGTITIYPNKNKAQPGDNYRRGTMIHETGHTWSYQQWGTDTTKGKWVDWKKAMDKDGNAVSGYAKASIAEDVAETVQVYGSTKGTPKYDEYKAMVPERMKILESEMG